MEPYILQAPWAANQTAAQMIQALYFRKPHTPAYILSTIEQKNCNIAKQINAMPPHYSSSLVYISCIKIDMIHNQNCGGASEVAKPLITSSLKMALKL